MSTTQTMFSKYVVQREEEGDVVEYYFKTIDDALSFLKESIKAEYVIVYIGSATGAY